MAQDHHPDTDLAEEASALLHAGLERARDLVKQTAQAIREHLPAEGAAVLQDDPQPLN